MTVAPETLDTETVVLLPVDQCQTSPTQPRRRGDKKGVIQPIIVRKRKAGGWEIVFGHRRHAGSVLAKRDTIPAIVRDLTDDEVFEQQLIENVQRADMHPLDEADAFKRMIDRGKTVQYIAERVGRPTTYVAQRLKLCELGKDARDALDGDEISLGVAVLIARVPASLQAEALEDLGSYRGDQVSAADARRTLEERYLLRLDHAPFDIASAELVPKAGACTVTITRTRGAR